MERDSRHIPNRLRKHRRLMNYKQTDVAFLLGLRNTNRIGKWEKGYGTPSLNNIIKLSIIYRTLISELYYELLVQHREGLVDRERLLVRRKAHREGKQESEFPRI